MCLPVAPGVLFPNRGCGHHCQTPFPAQTLPPPASGSLKPVSGHLGPSSPSDPGHTPAFFLWFLPDIRRGLKNFPQGKDSPECEFSSWANSQVQGGLQSWGGRRLRT